MHFRDVGSGSYDPLGLFVQCPRFVLCDILAGVCIGVFSALHRAQQIATTEHAFAVRADRFRCGVAGDRQ